MPEIVIEIGMERARLFQCNLFHCAEKSEKPKAIVKQRMPISITIFRHSGTPL